MRRTSTGNPRLDDILGGGLPRHSINILMGLPGTGKTVLAQQLAFATATPERPVLYLGTVSEPLPKAITYLQELSFADVTRIGSEIIYESLAEPLERDPGALGDRCTRLIQEHSPGVMIFDSFKAIAELVPDPREWRRLAFGLAGLLTAYDLTTLWVGEYDQTATSGLPEFAIADGIIQLLREQSGSRDDRFLRVLKLRGSGFQDGRHAFRIGAHGLDVFPRLVGPARGASQHPAERLKSGIGGLDEMIERGWLRGSSTLVEGPSGAGKTMLGLHFLRQGVADGEPGLLVTFEESPAQTARTMRSLGWDTDGLLGPGRLDIFHTSPVELQIDTIVQEMRQRIEQQGVRRVVIDALGDLKTAARDNTRFNNYVYALKQEFAVREVTAMLTFEAVSGQNSYGGPLASGEVSNMSDNILLLSMELGQDLTRSVRIIKTRASAHDGTRHVLNIGPSGIHIA